MRKWKILPVLALPRAAHSSFPPVLSMDGGSENGVRDEREGTLSDCRDRLSGERLGWGWVSPFSLSPILQPQVVLGSTEPLLMAMAWGPGPCSLHFLEGAIV